jgi:hypothetical protein
MREITALNEAAQGFAELIPDVLDTIKVRKVPGQKKPGLLRACKWRT